MSFWGGFVEGFATTAKEEIDKDVARTDKIVNDTVNIGVNKALEMQDEIKKDKKRIKTELEMLVGARFSLPKAASIVKAGLTSTMAKLALDTSYKGQADELWDGTTKFAQDNKLTVQDVVNKLSYQPSLDYGNLNVGSTQNSLLAAIGLSPNIDSRIQSGIKTRVGTLDTGVDRSDINILPGSLPTSVRSQFDTEKTLNIEQEIVKLEKEKAVAGGKLPPDKASLLETFKKYKLPSITKQLAAGMNTGDGSKLPINESLIKELYKKANNGDTKAESELDAEIARITKDYGKNTVNNLLDSLD